MMCFPPDLLTPTCNVNSVTVANMHKYKITTLVSVFIIILLYIHMFS